MELDMNLTVSIIENGKPILSDASAWLNVSQQGWSGFVLLTEKSAVKSGVCYQIETEDGRSGTIRIGHFAMKPGMGMGFDFTGHGPLQTTESDAEPQA